jgi:hypothetical protein
MGTYGRPGVPTAIRPNDARAPTGKFEPEGATGNAPESQLPTLNDAVIIVPVVITGIVIER